MAKKAKPVKWSLSATEPEDLQDFLSNDDIIQKHRKGKKGPVDWPGKGPFQFRVIRLTVKPNKNGDDRISVMLGFHEPKKSDAASWNGYVTFDGFNVTEQGAPFLKRWLNALGLTWEDFIKRSKQDDQDPPHIVQIGRVKFEDSKDVLLNATVKVKPADDYNDDEHMEIGRYLPADDGEDEDDDEEEEDVADMSDEDEGEDEAEEDEEEEDEDDEDEDEEDEEDEDEEEDDEDEEDEEDDEDEEEEEDEDAEEELREELSGLTKAALTKRAVRLAKKAKVSTDEVPSTKAKLIDFIVRMELEEPPF